MGAGSLKSGPIKFPAASTTKRQESSPASLRRTEQGASVCVCVRASEQACVCVRVLILSQLAEENTKMSLSLWNCKPGHSVVALSFVLLRLSSSHCFSPSRTLFLNSRDGNVEFQPLFCSLLCCRGLRPHFLVVIWSCIEEVTIEWLYSRDLLGNLNSQHIQ